MKKTILLAVLTVLVCSSAVWADGIVYNVDQTIGAGSVVGTITTDGTLGALAQSNIVNWNLTLNDGVNAFGLFGPLTGAENSFFRLRGADLNGSAEDLSFDFRSADSGYFLFTSSLAPGTDYAAPNANFWCGAGVTLPCYYADAGEDLRVVPDVVPDLPLNFRTVIGTVSAPADAPEPSTALLMLTGVALLVALRRRIASFRA